MTFLRDLYIRLDLLQRKHWFRLGLSVVAFLVCAIVFGSLLRTSYSLNAHRLALEPVLTGQNYQQNDEYAVRLYEEGTITVDGETYSSEAIRQAPDHIFAQDGTIGSPGYVIELLLADRRPGWAPDWLLEQPDTTWLLTIVTTAWLMMVIWLNASIPLLITLLATGLPIGLGVVLQRFEDTLSGIPLVSWLLFLASDHVMLYIAGLGLFTFTFVLLTRLTMLLYARPNQVLSVAHTVMKEASRTKLSLVFIVMLLLVLPLLPLHLDPDTPLRFRVQTFISRSFATTFAIAAVLTIFLSCASIAFEIRDRQIWQLMTKPMNRLSYLAGKWIGVMSLNLIILIVAGLSTFTFIQYLRNQPVAPGIEGQLDALAVRDQVLTARQAIRPTYDELTEEQLRIREEQVIAQDSELSVMDEVPLSVRRMIRGEIQTQYETGQRNVPSQQAKSYLFTGLDEAKSMQSSMTLRYRFYITRNDEHEVYRAVFRFNDDPATDRMRNYVPTQSHVIPIGTDLIRDDGTIKLDIYNAYVPPPDKSWSGSIVFEREDLELLYKVANFEGNFFRAILLMWIKLSFLSALGICCATFLSFPVACLTSFTVFLAGLLSPFVADSLASYTLPEWGRIAPGDIGARIRWVFTWCVHTIASGVVFLVSKFGEYKPTQRLVGGELIAWAQVFWGLVWLGLIWSGLSMIVGYVVIRSRQLAIYSGQG